MVSIARNEVARFQYSSVGNTAGEKLFAIGSANNSTKKVYITDLKLTCGGTGRTFTIYAQNYTAQRKAQSLTFAVPANACLDFAWELPYEIIVQGSTGTPRNIVASASGSGVNYTVCGYVER